MNPLSIFIRSRIQKRKYIPQLKPIINRPIMSISYDWAALEKAIRVAPRMPVALLRSSPRFLNL